MLRKDIHLHRLPDGKKSFCCLIMVPSPATAGEGFFLTLVCEKFAFDYTYLCLLTLTLHFAMHL